jgi:hypothetical protein
VDSRSGLAAAQTVLAIDAAIAGLAKPRCETNPIPTGPATPKLQNEPNSQPKGAPVAESRAGKAA